MRRDRPRAWRLARAREMLRRQRILLPRRLRSRRRRQSRRSSRIMRWRLLRAVRHRPLLFAFCLTSAKTAFADPCGHPDLLEAFPPDGAGDVPLNARLSARYASTAEYVDEEVTLEHVGIG